MTTNAIVPLDNENDPTRFCFVYGSEKNDHCQLFFVGAVFTCDDFTLIEKEITPRHFSVCKSTSAIVDLDQELVYYVASPHDFTETAVCVSNYLTSEPNYRQLTPLNHSIKTERAYHRLALLSKYGFVCFTTAYNKPPVCQFFNLRHLNALPEAEVTGTVSYNITNDIQPFARESELPRFFKFKLNDSGYEIAGMVMMPPGADPNLKYPVLHYVYGGPGIQLVRNDFTCWVQYQKYCKAGFAFVMLDGRGSANRGRKFEANLYENFGDVEVRDQVQGLQELARLMDGRLDLDRVIVHGWSYGGYLSLRLLASHPEVYRGAIAGGAVYDWKLYDTAYTERYLGLPDKECYPHCSLAKSIRKLPDEPGRLLILHGLLDENVHFRHTETLIDGLLKEGKPYQLQMFPSERHGVRSIESAQHQDATFLHFMQSVLRIPRF